MRLFASSSAILLAVSTVGCSSSSSPEGPSDTVSPAALEFVQDRTVDRAGETLAITFSEQVTATTALDPALYTLTGGLQVLAAELRPGGTVVELTLDSVALPGAISVSVGAGIEDEAGNASEALAAQPITSTDTVAPTATELTATAVEGAANDVIAVRFDDDMLPADVEDTARWTVESPLGTPFEVTGSLVSYDAATRTAQLTLGPASVDQDLGTLNSIQVALGGLRDLGGNVLQQTAIGTTALIATVGGDVTPPAALAAAPGVGETIVVTFSEPVAGLSTSDLRSPSNPAGVEIVLTDVDNPGEAATGSITISGIPTDGDVIEISDGSVATTFEFDAATGSIEFTGVPNDGDSVTINDGGPTTVFEFDSNGSVAGGAVSVAIGATSADTAATLRDEINDDGTIATRALIQSSPELVLLFTTQIGTAPNQPLVENDTANAMTLVGMSGGGFTADEGVNINPFFSWANASNLRFSIDSTSGFNVTAFNESASDLVTLENDALGTAGNVNILVTESGDIIEGVGMSGGLGPGIRVFEPISLSSTLLQTIATFDVAPTVDDTFRIYGIRDLAGNQMTPVVAFSATVANANPPGFDAMGPELIAVSGAANDTVGVGFDLDLNPTGLKDLANYTLVGTGGAVDLTGAAIAQTASNALELTLKGGDQLASGATYTFSVAGLSSRQGVPIALAESAGGLAVAGDTTPPTAGVGDARLDPSTSNAVLLPFSEAVEAAGATDAASYAIAGRTVVSASQLHPRAVRVVFDSQPLIADVLDIDVAALTDLAGNPAAASASVAIVAADESAPIVANIDPTNGGGVHQFVLSFDEPLQPATAVNLANYAAEVVGSGAVPLDGAFIEHDTEANTVTIVLVEGVYLPTGETLSVTVNALMDLAGNAILPAATTAMIQGDATAPSSAVAFVDRQADTTESTVEVVFPEDMNAATTLQLSRWQGSNGQLALAVMPIGDRRFRVIFDAPIAQDDMIEVTAPTDAALNAGANLILDPIE